MAGRLHASNSLTSEFHQGRAPELNDVLGVFTNDNAVLGLDVMGARRINDRMFTGPRGAVGRYNVSVNATNVAQTPYGSSQ
jgi:hypothetical protein